MRYRRARPNGQPARVFVVLGGLLSGLLTFALSTGATTHHGGPPVAWAMAAGTCFAWVVGIGLVFPRNLDIRGLLRLLLVGLVAAPATGVVVWILVASAENESILTIDFRLLGAAGVCGSAIALSAYVAVLSGRGANLAGSRRELLLAVTVLSAATILVAGTSAAPSLLVAPGLVWLAIRWHTFGGAVGSMMASLVVAITAASDVGRFGGSLELNELTQLASFVAFAVGGSIILGQVSEERDAAQAAVIESLARVERGLEGQTKSYETLLGNLVGMAYRCGLRDWVPEFISTGSTELFGWTPEEFMAGDITFVGLIDPLDRDLVHGDEAASVRTGETFHQVYRVRHRSGEIRWVSETGRVVQHDGRYSIEGFIVDVTDIHRGELQSGMQASVLSRALSGGRLDELMGDVCQDFLESWTAGSITMTRIDPEVGNQVLADRQAPPHPDDEALWNFSQSIGLASGSNLVVVVGTRYSPTPQLREAVHRLTQLIALLDEQQSNRLNLEHAASHDWLGIGNRRSAEQAVQAAMSRCSSGQGHAVVVGVNPTRFRQFNETFGSEVGDSLLLAMRDRIQQVRSVVLVARISGAEFIVVADTSDASSDAARLVATEIKSMVEMPFTVGAQNIKMRARVGFTSCEQERDESVSQISDADNGAALLYEAQLAAHEAQLSIPAPNQFQTSLRTAAERRARLTHSLLRAIESGNIEVQYQPEIDLRTGKVFGVEALARWTHGDTPVAPDEFIPIAEESGFIVPLGAHVLARALDDLRDYDCLISVNVSPLQLVDPQFLDRLELTLEQTESDPKRLCLEITETALRDMELIRPVPSAVRRLGISISIDDFGTGYSSLSQLTQLPLDFLKVDRSFVARLGTSKVDDAVMGAMLTLAQSMGLSVIAEGVERADQEDMLISLGCELVQGWHYSRPVTRDNLDKVFRAWA